MTTTLDQQLDGIHSRNHLGRGRAPKGRTYDACHGCGQPPQNWQGRPKEGVCESCEAALKLAKQVAKSQEAATDTAIFSLPAQPHWLPYLPERGERSKRAIQTGFWELAKACSSPAMNPDCEVFAALVQSRKGDSSNYRGDSRDARVFGADVAQKLQRLYAAVDDGLRAAYVAGEEHGASLLAQLASGDITAGQFNEYALRRKE